MWVRTQLVCSSCRRAPQNRVIQERFVAAGSLSYVPTAVRDGLLPRQLPHLPGGDGVSRAEAERQLARLAFANNEDKIFENGPDNVGTLA
jgi:hypothetical protein